MEFEKRTKPDLEILNAFKPVRKNFDYSYKSAIKQLNKLLDDTAEFYKVYDKNRFIACICVNEINEQEKTIDFGGFALRHTNTLQIIREFVAYLKYRFPTYAIQATTEIKAARFCLIRAGFKNKGGNTYEYG